MNDQDFKIGQLTKELVSLKLKEMEDPCAVAAGLVQKAITVALKTDPSQAKTVVTDACYGGMQGLLLAERDLARGAAQMLQAVCDAANDCSQDPGEMMRYGLAGIARIAKFVPQEGLTHIRIALEDRFHGVGDAFVEALKAENSAQKV